MTEPNHLWNYWQDREGTLEALEARYPHLLGRIPALQMAIHSIRANEALIEKIMGDLPDDFLED